MNKGDTSVLKIIEFLARVLPLIVLLGIVSLTITPILVHARQSRGRVLYREDFNDGLAQDWRKWWGSGMWIVQNQALVCRGEVRARYTKGNWGDGQFALRFKLKSLSGNVHVNIHIMGNKRYAIGLRRAGRESFYVYCLKQYEKGQPVHIVKDREIQHNLAKQPQMEIVSGGGIILVRLGESTVIKQSDDAPLPPGTIGFETGEDSYAEVDDIEILGQPRPAPLPDLFIKSADEWRLEDNKNVLLLIINIGNAGKARSTETKVFARDPEHRWPSPMMPVRALNPGESQRVEIRLRIPDNQRDITHTFLVEVDPDGQIPESNKRNNTARTPEIPIQPKPRPAPLPDLIIESLKGYRFDEDSGTLELIVYVENSGGAEARQTDVAVLEPHYNWARIRQSVRALNPKERREIELRLKVPDEARGTTQTFLLKIDPDELIDELEDRNNELKQKIAMGESILPPKLSWRFIVPVAVTATFALGAIAVTIGSIIKFLRRKKWQKKAKEKEPPEKCKPCTYYCRKIELELELHRRKITKLLLTAYDSVSGEQSKDGQLKGKIVDNLNKRIKAPHIKKQPKKLQKQMLALSKAFSKQAIKWLQGESAARDVSITAHLEGGQVSCEFILYHCRRKGTTTAWKEVDRWKKSMKDQRDISIGTLCALDPTDPAMEGKLVPQVTQLLMQFVENV